MKLSVVVPMYNESEGVEAFHDTMLLPSLKKHAANSYEIVYVNDGSTDDTLAKLQSIARGNGRVKVVCLSRNFGKEIATSAGIAASTGDATLIMDGDGQHPPKLIGQFLRKWEKGARVVIGVRRSNQAEGIIKKWGSRLFYRMFNGFSSVKIVPRSTDFRLIDRSVRTEFLKFTERNRITRGLIDWLGFNREYIVFDAPARFSGTASYSLRGLIGLALNSFVSLSLKPLFAFGWLGLVITLLSLLSGVAIFVEQFLLGDPLSLNFTGSALLGIFISFMVGLLLVSQGVTAIYLSHVHNQAQERPLYVIDDLESVNLKK